MFADLSIFKMSSMMASHAGRRQALAAQNMANVDTPGYQAHRLKSFASLTESQGPRLSLRGTRDTHLGLPVANRPQADVQMEDNSPAPDGNTVSAEVELLESINAKREHERALAIYKSALNILHTSIGRR